jgi:hypothetical protein
LKNVVVGFLVKQKWLTPEDFTEEQLMMRDSVKEFVDKVVGTQRSF